jgi:hypothetical protein
VIRVLRPKTDEEGGCSAPPPFDPVSIPHDIEKRGVTTGSDREPNRPVDGPLRPPMQVTEPAGLNLSRWRHGFEPRWDYTEKRRSETLFSVSGNLRPTVRPAFVPRPTATRHK